MSPRLILIYCLLLISASSCAKKSFLSSKVQPWEIKEMMVFEPVSDIYIINRGNKMEYSDSLSYISGQLWLNVVNQNRNRLPVNMINILEENFTKVQIQEETKYLFKEVSGMKKFHSIPLPPSIKAHLELSGNRFGMLTATSGFTRKKGNLTGQMLKSIGIGIVTFGMVMIIPYTAQSNVSVLILDNERDEVVYYKASNMLENQPLKELTLNRHLDYLYKNYLW
ncbi:hypothetical protein [Anditalea andensis]|uniref:Lipoprotein n=1 Tax=Anditalea andensis TaxID=1048983 RepID=A0A074L7A7_9BACT|nr:hypothetical protein [Anditalea andensis]KEO75723.1 hypothetical protein EL17_22110 [Anditalea andensis]